MAIFNKPLSAYFNQVKTGIYLIAALTVIRFLMQPAFGIPYEQGTTFTSVTILLLILGAFYTYRASQESSTTYRDILGIVFVLAMSAEILVSVAIAVDDFAGIQTYYTAEGHSVANTGTHIIGHILVGIVMTLVLWGVGSLIKKLFGAKIGEAVA